MEITNLNDIDLIIAPSDLHGDILKSKNKYPHLNFKLINKEQVLEEYLGRISSKSIGYLINNYGLSFENALVISKFINRGNKLSQDEKIKYLGDLKEELTRMDFFEKSLYFSYEISKKRVLVIGYENDLELENILEPLAKFVQFEPFKIGVLRPDILKFKSINEEVFYVFNEVCKLINDGISLNEILIIAQGEEYQTAINKMCDFFMWPHAMDIKTPLFACESIQEEFKKIQELSLKTYLNNNPNKQILNIVETYNLSILDNDVAVNNLREILKHEHIISRGHLNLRVTSSLPFVNEYKKVFLLGFNQGNYPIIKKNDEYLSDKVKSSLGMLTSKQESQVNKMRAIDFITNQDDLIITYKINAKNTSYYPSAIIQELGLKVIKPPLQQIVYSKKYAELVLASQMDLKRIYNEISQSLLMYQKSLKIPYKTFNYRFNGVLSTLDNQKRTYSYSRLKSFFECQFAYYCKHILKLDSFESSFATNFGSLAHKVLERVYEPDYDFEKEFNDAIKDYAFNEGEKVILNRRREDILHIAQILKEHYQEMKIKRVFAENKYTLNLNENVSLFGIIDRIFVTTDGNKDYFTIVDYKTGEEKIDLDLVQFGYSMQLPIYALLLANDYSLNDFLGFYIQPLTLNKIGIPIVNRLEFYKKHIKLQGFSLDNTNALQTFDQSYENSKYIKSLRVKNDGTFYTTAKVLSLDRIKEIVNIARQQVLSADEKIINNQFNINPKIVSGVSACKFCAFNDVCFKENDAFIYLNKDEGGANDVD